MSGEWRRVSTEQIILKYSGKCELFHWIDILDLCDEILEAATLRGPGSWVLACDQPGPEAKRSKGKQRREVGCGLTVISIFRAGLVDLELHHAAD